VFFAGVHMTVSREQIVVDISHVV